VIFTALLGQEYIVALFANYSLCLLFGKCVMIVITICVVAVLPVLATFIVIDFFENPGGPL
jgi:hypothetical protein